MNWHFGVVIYQILALLEQKTFISLEEKKPVVNKNVDRCNF
jgi:hypothetical protein